MYNNLGELKSFIESQMKENKSCDTVAIAYETLEQKEFIASNYYVVSENEDNEGKFLMVKNESVFGTVEFEGKKYILAQQAYVDNANGTDGDVIYTASAEDVEGNKYKVVWETTKDFDDSQELHHLEDLIEDIGMEELTEESQERYNELIEDDVNSGYCEDESNACDWDSPASVTKI